MGSGGTIECQETKMRTKARSSADEQSSSKKESIQPQVPLRLPCYDFTSVTPHTVTNIHLHPIKRRNFGVFGAKSFNDEHSSSEASCSTKDQNFGMDDHLLRAYAIPRV
jgi:hypothetical protein